MRDLAKLAKMMYISLPSLPKRLEEDYAFGEPARDGMRVDETGEGKLF